MVVLVYKSVELDYQSNFKYLQVVFVVIYDMSYVYQLVLRMYSFFKIMLVDIWIEMVSFGFLEVSVLFNWFN